MAKNVTVVAVSETVAITSVADTTTSAELAAAKTAGSIGERQMLSIINTSSAVLYILIGTGTASASNHSVSLAQRGYFELPKTDGGLVYQGAIQGVWASDPGDGVALMTEYR